MTPQTDVSPAESLLRSAEVGPDRFRARNIQTTLGRIERANANYSDAKLRQHPEAAAVYQAEVKQLRASLAALTAVVDRSDVPGWLAVMRERSEILR